MNDCTRRSKWVAGLLGLLAVTAFQARATEVATGRMDRAHSGITASFQGAVERLDMFFSGDEEDQPPPRGTSKLAMGIDVVLEEDDGVKTEVDLDFRLDIALPRTGRRLGLFIRSSLPDELPDQDPQTTENALLLGVHRSLDKRKKPALDFSLGVKVRASPSLFSSVQLRRDYRAGAFTITPTLKGFWQSDDGFGELQSVRIDRRLDNGVLLRSSSAARWTEVSEGVEWSQSFLVALSRKGTFRDLDRGIGLKGQIVGHKNGEAIVDEYRLGIIYRRPVWRPWLFMRIGPEVAWRNEDNWDAIPGFRIGFDALLWGKEELEP